jgi:hypothetical protein
MRHALHRRSILLAGSSIVIVGIAVVAWFWSHPARSTQNQALYDYCLVQQHGNTVTCDAWMRIVTRRIAHERVFEAALYRQAAQLHEAGFSGCEIELWAAKDTEAVGSELSTASGIPLSEIQAGKCDKPETTEGRLNQTDRERAAAAAAEQIRRAAPPP